MALELLSLVSPNLISRLKSPLFFYYFILFFLCFRSPASPFSPLQFSSPPLRSLGLEANTDGDAPLKIARGTAAPCARHALLTRVRQSWLAHRSFVHYILYKSQTTMPGTPGVIDAYPRTPGSGAHSPAISTKD